MANQEEGRVGFDPMIVKGLVLGPDGQHELKKQLEQEGISFRLWGVLEFLIRQVCLALIPGVSFPYDPMPDGQLLSLSPERLLMAVERQIEEVERTIRSDCDCACSICQNLRYGITGVFAPPVRGIVEIEAALNFLSKVAEQQELPEYKDNLKALGLNPVTTLATGLKTAVEGLARQCHRGKIINVLSLPRDPQEIRYSENSEDSRIFFLDKDGRESCIDTGDYLIRPDLAAMLSFIVQIDWQEVPFYSVTMDVCSLIYEHFCVSETAGANRLIEFRLKYLTQSPSPGSYEFSVKRIRDRIGKRNERRDRKDELKLEIKKVWPGFSRTMNFLKEQNGLWLRQKPLWAPLDKEQGG